MKIQIAFDLTDLEKSISIAAQLEKYTDIFEVGSLLIFKYGEVAVKTFKEKFPHKQILADVKITEKAKETVNLVSSSNADWITVLAGSGKNIIHTACTTAHALGKKIMLDLTDASSLGQSALEAKSFGADALLMHKPHDEEEQMLFMDRWEMVKGNTTLPIFIAGINKENLAIVKSVNADGIVLGKAITQAEDPLQALNFFYETLNNSIK